VADTRNNAVIYVFVGISYVFIARQHAI